MNCIQVASKPGLAPHIFFYSPVQNIETNHCHSGKLAGFLNQHALPDGGQKHPLP